MFIGDVALDEYFRPSAWPAVAKIELEPLGSYVGGMIANAAAVHAALGDDTRFVWTMRPGEATRRLLADLEGLGVDTALVTFADHLADSRNIILLAGDDHVVMTPALGLRAIDLADETVQAMCEARFVYTAIGDLRALRHGELGALDVIDRFRAAGTPLVLDLDVCATQPGDADLIDRVDLLLVNAVGFERLSSGRPAGAVVADLLAAGTSVVVRTLGAAGCRVSTRAGEVAVEGLDVDVVDVTGAGDTFGAAFAFALGRADSVLAAATFANAAAARAVTAMGARSGIATVRQVSEFMDAFGLSVPIPQTGVAPFLPVPPPSERHLA